LRGACISGIERDLAQMDGVNSARLNLTLKRLSVDARSRHCRAAMSSRGWTAGL
jgi:hypothetical protein